MSKRSIVKVDFIMAICLVVKLVICRKIGRALKSYPGAMNGFAINGCVALINVSLLVAAGAYYFLS